MKKKLVLLASVLLLAALFMISSCAKENTTPPFLQLTGGNTVAQALPNVKNGGTWVDPGYSAKESSEDLTNQVRVYGTVNPNIKGVYTLTYAVKDASGNVSTQTRTVTVYNDADSLANVYSVVDSTVYPFAVTGYAITITSDLYTDSVVHFNTFAGLNNDSTVIGRVNRITHTLVVQHQKVMFYPVISTLPQTHAFTGAGTDSTGALIPSVIHFTYTDSTTGGKTVHHTRWIN